MNHKIRLNWDGAKVKKAMVVQLTVLLGLLTACQVQVSPTPSVVVGSTSPVANSATVQPDESKTEYNPGLTLNPALEPPLDAAVLSIAVPDFLSSEQQNLYRQAYSLYMHMFGGFTSAIEKYELPNEAEVRQDYERVEINNEIYMVSQGRYRNWEDFNAVIHAVFTEDFWSRRNTLPTGDLLYTSYDGKLCFIDGERGSGYFYNANFPDEFTLLEETDTSILFTLIGHYTSVYPLEGETDEERDARRRSSYDYTIEFPIKMVLTENGWRFDDFYSALADEEDCSAGAC